MPKLSLVLVFKIAATVVVWCVPLILFPASWLQAAGLPWPANDQFIRMLGWAYLALCVGYGFGLRESLQGRAAVGPIWMGIVSNGGACLYLLYYGATGTWETWGGWIQFIAWGSVVATALITAGLVQFGLRGSTDTQESGALV